MPNDPASATMASDTARSGNAMYVAPVVYVVVFFVFLVLMLTPLIAFGYTLYASSNFTRPSTVHLEVARLLGSQDAAFSLTYKIFTAVTAISIPMVCRSWNGGTMAIFAGILVLLVFLCGGFAAFMQSDDVIVNFQTIIAGNPDRPEDEHVRRIAALTGAIQGYFSQMQQVLLLVLGTALGIKVAAK